MDIAFHSDAKTHFQLPHQFVRAFVYKNYSIPYHSHDFYEMNIILSGTGTHCIEDMRVPVQSGDVFVIPPLIRHAYTDTEGLDVYHILLKKEFIQDNRAEVGAIKGYFPLMEIEPYLRRNGSQESFLHLSPSQLLQFSQEIKFIEDDGVFDAEDMTPIKHHSVWRLICYFSYLLYHQLHDKEETPTSKHRQLIVDALEYIHLHYAEPLSISLLCKRAFLSRSTFLRHFSTICGCSPMQYVNAYRVKMARQMLSDALISKTEIAHACGFYDLSHMHRSLRASEDVP